VNHASLSPIIFPSDTEANYLRPQRGRQYSQYSHPQTLPMALFVLRADSPSKSHSQYLTWQCLKLTFPEPLRHRLARCRILLDKPTGQRPPLGTAPSGPCPGVAAASYEPKGCAQAGSHGCPSQVPASHRAFCGLLRHFNVSLSHSPFSLTLRSLSHPYRRRRYKCRGSLSGGYRPQHPGTASSGCGVSSIVERWPYAELCGLRASPAGGGGSP